MPEKNLLSVLSQKIIPNLGKISKCSLSGMLVIMFSVQFYNDEG